MKMTIEEERKLRRLVHLLHTVGEAVSYAGVNVYEYMRDLTDREDFHPEMVDAEVFLRAADKSLQRLHDRLEKKLAKAQVPRVPQRRRRTLTVLPKKQAEAAAAASALAAIEHQSI